jgi:hypothetical protein
MSLRRAFVLACLLVLPGVLLRLGPHAHLLSTISESATISSGDETQQDDSVSTAAGVPRRLSQRPLFLLVLGFAVEVGMHAALIVILLRSVVLVSLFSALPRSGRMATVLFFGALMAGFLGGHDATYPFVTWRMYSGQPSADPTVCLVDGETRTGAAARIDMNGLLPALGPRRLHHIIKEQAEAMLTDGTTSPESARLRLRLQRTLLGVASLYNSRHPEDPLVRIRAALAIVPLDVTEPPWLRQQREVISIDLDPQV